MPHGFQIVRFGDVPGWKPVAWSEINRTTYVDRISCPVHNDCGDIVSLVGTNETVRINCCPVCGLVGYRDRPTNETIANYYKSTWMGETVSDAALKAHDAIKLIAETKRDALPVYPMPKDSPVLEVGVGYGAQVALLQRLGYTDIEGVEACPARAQAVRDACGVNVYDGDFTSLNFTKQYSGIFATHVLEHIPAPLAFIAKCAEIQPPGGKLILSVPNFYAEPSVGVLLFWPHLWSFAATALTSLLNHCGYVVEHLAQASSIEIVGSKAAHQDAVKANAAELDKIRATFASDTASHFQLATNKLLVGLGLAHADEMVLTWQKNCDGAAIHPRWHDECLNDTNRWNRSMVIRPVHEYRTDSPIEIQFDGPIQLFYK